jgi:hypothetical protein
MTAKNPKCRGKEKEKKLKKGAMEHNPNSATTTTMQIFFCSEAQKAL